MPIPGLAAAIRAAAPRADAAAWTAALTGPLRDFDVTTPRRVAALLGQVAVEAGPALAGLSELTLYTHAERLCAVFPREFPSLSAAAPYVGDARAIACRVYAGRLGNGGEGGGDGWTFRGAGLLQLTGRSTIAAFGADVDPPLAAEDAADYLRTPEGAALGACWFWDAHGLNAFADAWSISAISRAVNGPAMLQAAARLAASNAALKALGG